MGVQEMVTQSLTQHAAGGVANAPAPVGEPRLASFGPADTNGAGDVTLTAPSLQRRYDDLSLEHQGLVLVRALLELRGVSEAELIAHDARTARVRAELDRLGEGQAADRGQAA